MARGMEFSQESLEKIAAFRASNGEDVSELLEKEKEPFEWSPGKDTKQMSRSEAAGEYAKGNELFNDSEFIGGDVH